MALDGGVIFAKSLQIWTKDMTTESDRNSVFSFYIAAILVVLCLTLKSASASAVNHEHNLMAVTSTNQSDATSKIEVKRWQDLRWRAIAQETIDGYAAIRRAVELDHQTFIVLGVYHPQKKEIKNYVCLLPVCEDSKVEISLKSDEINSADLIKIESGVLMSTTSLQGESHFFFFDKDKSHLLTIEESDYNKMSGNLMNGDDEKRLAKSLFIGDIPCDSVKDIIDVNQGRINALVFRNSSFVKFNPNSDLSGCLYQD